MKRALLVAAVLIVASAFTATAEARCHRLIRRPCRPCCRVERPVLHAAVKVVTAPVKVTVRAIDALTPCRSGRCQAK